MHVGPFLCQRGQCPIGSCLRLGTRTVGPVIGAAAGTFVAVVVGEDMVGAEVGTLGLALGRMGFALSA